MLGLKNLEREPQFQKWKGRLVALGNRVFGKDGKRIVDALHHIVPASLTSVRMLFALESMRRDGVTLQGDVPGAYVTAKLGGPATYLSLPPHLRPRNHPKWNGMKQPVMRIWMAIYGLGRSGLD